MPALQGVLIDLFQGPTPVNLVLPCSCIYPENVLAYALI